MEPSKRLYLQLQLPETRGAAIAVITKALDAAAGSTLEAAEALGVNYRTFCRWVAAHPALATAVSEAREAHGREDAARDSPATGGAKKKGKRK